MAFAGRKIDAARPVGGAGDHENSKECGNSEEGDSGDHFHRRWPRKFVPSGRGGRQTRTSPCQRTASRTATYCRTLLTNAGSALEWNFALRPDQSMLFN